MPDIQKIVTISTDNPKEFDEQYNAAIAEGYIPLSGSFFWGERLTQQMVQLEDSRIAKPGGGPRLVN